MKIPTAGRLPKVRGTFYANMRLIPARMRTAVNFFKKILKKVLTLTC